jgi:hypothetical protein
MKKILLLQKLCTDMNAQNTYTHSFDFLLTQFHHVIQKQNAECITLSTPLSVTQVSNLINKIDNRLEVVCE